MNERIFELAEQAREWATEESKAGKNICHVGSDYFLALEKEKFAELLIEECVNLMENQREHYYSKVLGQQSAEHYDRVVSKGDAFDDAVTIIRSHFRN